MRRMVHSAKAFRIPLPYSAEDLSKAALELVRANDMHVCYLRPIAFLGAGSLGLNPTGATSHTSIAAWEWGSYLGKSALEEGARVRVSSWRRIGHEALIPNAKGTGQYINSVLAKQEAVTAGYDEALMLNYEGYVAEGSGQNIFLVRDRTVSTPPSTAGALEGITRDTVMKLLADDGYEVCEAQVTRSDLYYADEAFFTGTAAEVTPIREIDDRPVGEGRPGPITRRTQQLFKETVTGELEPYRHWLEYA
jgi:branched-chain amino acid aminotransferase